MIDGMIDGIMMVWSDADDVVVWIWSKRGGGMS